MIEERRHPDDHLRIDLGDHANVSVRSHDLAASTGEHEGIEADTGIVRLPEGEVGGIREGIDVAERDIGIAKFHEPFTGRLKIVQVVARVDKRDGIGGTSGRACHENGSQLVLETALRSGWPVAKHAGDCSRLFAKDRGIGSDDEVARVVEIAFGSEWEPSEIVRRPDISSGQVVSPEQTPVMCREGHKPCSQEAS